MNALIYSRVSSQSQENKRQIIELKKIAEEKGWMIKRTFQEKISGTINSDARPEFNAMVKYINDNNIHIVMVSEVSRVGRRVVDILNSVEMLHTKDVGVYIKQFNILTLQDGKENQSANMLLQMFSIGSQMENDLRKIRQKEGIALAKINGKYRGRKVGAKSNPSDLLLKYKDVVDLISKSDLSLRRISEISGRSINTVRKVKKMVAL